MWILKCFVPLCQSFSINLQKSSLEPSFFSFHVSSIIAALTTTIRMILVLILRIVSRKHSASISQCCNWLLNNPKMPTLHLHHFCRKIERNVKLQSISLAVALPEYNRELQQNIWPVKLCKTYFFSFLCDLIYQFILNIFAEIVLFRFMPNYLVL